MDTTAAAVVDTTAAIPESSGDPMDGLKAFFAAEEQVDNSDDGASTDEVVADEPAKEPEEEVGETETEEPEAEAIEADKITPPATDDEEADFDALNQTPEFPDAEGLKAKFPRQSKEFYAYAADLSAKAAKGHEVVAQLGGEAFIPSLAQISNGIRTGENGHVFEGIIEASGPEGLIGTLAAALEVSLMRGTQYEEQPQTAAFGRSLNALAEAAMLQRFGPAATIENLEKLTKLAEIGWLDKIEEWQKEGWVDNDQAQELFNAGNDPKLQAELAKKAELKTQLADKNAKEQAASAQLDSQVENSFSQTVTEEIGKTLESIVWAKSPLRDLDTDTAELKAEKAFLRDRLKSDAIKAFNESENRKTLVEGFKHGKGKTAVFVSKLAEEIGNAIGKTRESTAIAVGMLAKLHGKTRNSKLTTPRRDGAAPLGSEPTIPAPAVPPSDSQPKSKADVQSNLQKAFEALG